jgi:hypothetical protein
MMERWCAWHKPEPILMGVIDDGKSEVTRTDGMCPECEIRVRREAGLGGTFACDPTARDSKGFPLTRDQLD